jgi:hypothetical protein
MKRLLVATCLVLLAANQGFALSCSRPSVEDSYISHSKADENFILVTGKLTNKRNVVLGPVMQGMRARSESFTASFVGHQASRAGFDWPIKTTVAVSTLCAGPWCGTVEVDTPMLTFLEVTPYGHQLSVGPCAGSVFYTPTKDQNRRILQCLRGGVCTPQTR